MDEWIGRDEALARLQVRPQTLYAYVSRGRIGVRSNPSEPRRSLYRTDDVEALKARRSRGRGRAAIASGALSWGEPSMATAISTIRQGRLIYRGFDAIALARIGGWEEAARLLWDSERTIQARFAPGAGTDPFNALAALVGDSYPALGRGEDRLHADAEDAIGRLAAAFGAGAGEAPLHERLAHGWGLEARFAEPIRRVLVVLADHEFNASTFAVRIAASTGASIPACLLAGLAALSGPRHGGAGAGAVALIDDARRSGVKAAVASRLALGQGLPGFGHPLYPASDPRATAVLEALPQDALHAALRRHAEAVCGAPPNIDFALAALTRSGGLPDDAPFRLFAMARAIGWTAHAVEQVQQGGLIRPRARYDGPVPVDAASTQA